MDIYVDGLHPIKRFLYKVASYGLYPTIFSAIGFAYIGAPSNLQIWMRHSLPIKFREHMLMLCNTDTWLIILFFVTVACAMWGGVGSQATVSLVNRKHKEVLEENEQLKDESDSKSINCYKLFTNYLYCYFRRFDLGPNERVSLYKLDMEMFSCIGRYSDNELFKFKPNRLYPRTQGCIAKAWEIGKCEDANAPDPITDLAGWKQYNIDKYNFDINQLERIRMKCRAYYGIRLQNAQNITVAVLLFESLNNNGLPFGKIQRFFEANEMRNIVNLIESVENHIPKLQDARAEGF
jgi:hypothetical protein